MTACGNLFVFDGRSVGVPRGDACQPNVASGLLGLIVNVSNSVSSSIISVPFSRPRTVWVGRRRHKPQRRDPSCSSPWRSCARERTVSCRRSWCSCCSWLSLRTSNDSCRGRHRLPRGSPHRRRHCCRPPSRCRPRNRRDKGKKAMRFIKKICIPPRRRPSRMPPWTLWYELTPGAKAFLSASEASVNSPRVCVRVHVCGV
jgi:hypothetical protein